MKEKIKKKNSNIELLRIIAMLLIVAHHYALHGLASVTLTYSVDRIVYNWLVIGGKAGVNIFVLITGYYMCKSKFTLDKFLKLYGQVAFYSVAIFLAFKFMMVGHYDYNIYQLVKSLFPILNNKYWFITTYIYLMFLTPIINRMINTIGKKKLCNLIIISILLCSLIPNIINIYNPINSILWFILLYLIGAYIRIYGFKVNTKKTFALTIIFYILMILFNIMIDKSQQLELITGLLFAATIFIHIVNIKPKNNKFVSLVGSSVFGIYLIHDNDLVRSCMWKKIFHCPDYYGTGYLLVHALITITIVFIICSIIEIIRIKTVEKIWNKNTSKIIIPYINDKRKKIENIYKIIKRRLNKKEKVIQEKYIKIIILLSTGLSLIILLYLTKDIVGNILIYSNSKTETLFKLIEFVERVLIYLFTPIMITLLIVFNKIYNKIQKHKLEIIIRTIISGILIYIIKIIKKISIKKLIFDYYILVSNSSYIYFIILLLIVILLFSIEICNKKEGEFSAKKRKKL